MTAATVVELLDINDPTCEEVILTASDTNTYVSKVFGSLRCGLAQFMENTSTLSIPLSLGISGNTVTINCTGLSSKKVALRLRGFK